MTPQEAEAIMLEEMGICPECRDHLPCGCNDEYPDHMIPFDYVDEKRRSESE
jgi:hypothetical protein